MSARPLVTLREALSDPNLLGHALSGDSWKAWRILLIAAMGEALTDEERVTFTQLTRREREPGERVEEFWGVIGRRGGKSRAMGCLSVYLAAFVEYSDVLSPGEKPIVLCMAQNQLQARIVLGYATGILRASPMLRGLVRNELAEAVSLTNGVSLEVRAANFRGLRGPTFVAVIADEAAFWFTDDDSSRNADTEILDAVRPGLATTGGPLIVISSPYSRRGEVYTAWKAHYGANGDPLILVAQGASRDLNPSLRQSVVDRAMERDPASAAAEYLANFRTDIESFISREAVEACVDDGLFERPPASGVRYVAFTDPSGGSADSFSLAISHRTPDGRVQLDLIRERAPPFSPENVVSEFAADLKSYHCSSVGGDKYAGEFPRELFRKHGIRYEPSERSKSEIYVELLPLINSRRIDLLDDRKAIGQLVNLERRTSRVGKDSIDHPPGGHDDRINAVAGALVLAQSKAPMTISKETMEHSRMSPLMRRLSMRQNRGNIAYTN